MTETNGTLRVGGAITLFALSSIFNRESLKQGLAALGLEKFLPEACSNAVAMRMALNQVFKELEVACKKDKTYECVLATPREYGTPNDRVIQHYWKIDDLGGIEVSGYVDWQREQQVRSAYHTYLGCLFHSSVSTMLVNILGTLEGSTRLRPTGAIYWLPDTHLSRWKEIADAVNNASVSGESKIYFIRHKLDEDALTAVRDAVVRECQEEANKIKEMVKNEEIGEQFCKNREKDAVALVHKVQRFEELLGVSLEILQEAGEQARVAASTAAMLRAAGCTTV